MSANALALPFPDTTFDIVAAKSVLGGIKLKRGSVKTGSVSAARAATKEIHRVLRPNGSFLGAENMVGSLAHRAGRALRSHQTRWWLYLTDDDLGTLFESFSLVERDYYGCLGTHWGHTATNTWAATIDRILCPLLPRSSLYMGFVHARK